MDDKWRFIGLMGRVHSSLGAYSSVKEGVLMVLKGGNLKPAFREDLESLRKKGDELGWDEDELFNAFSE